MIAQFLFLAAAASQATAGPTQFDLQCTHKNGNPGVSLRINLSSGEWCNTRTGCKTIERIVDVTSGKIVLSDKKPNFGGDELDYAEVNRLTGEYYSNHVGIVSFSSVQDCSLAPFGGPMPTRKF